MKESLDKLLIKGAPNNDRAHGLFAYVVANEVTLVLPEELVSSIKNDSLFLRQMKNTAQ